MDTVRTIYVHFSFQRANLHLTYMLFFRFFSTVIFKVIVFIL